MFYKWPNEVGLARFLYFSKYSLTKSPTSGSRLAVGSSRNNNLGLLIKDFAKDTLFFWPEDSSPVFLFKKSFIFKS